MQNSFRQLFFTNILSLLVLQIPRFFQFHRNIRGLTIRWLTGYHIRNANASLGHNFIGLRLVMRVNFDQNRTGSRHSRRWFSKKCQGNCEKLLEMTFFDNQHDKLPNMRFFCRKHIILENHHVIMIFSSQFGLVVWDLDFAVLVQLWELLIAP